MASQSQKARQRGVVRSLRGLAETVYEHLERGRVPEMSIPLRTKSNIRFNARSGVWTYGRAKGTRSAKTLKGAKMLLRTLYVLDFIQDMIQDGKSSTLRELYYISEAWEHAGFATQDESNLLAEDLEILTGSLREDFRLRPEEDGARVMGNLTVEELNRRGHPKRFNCRDDVGDSGYGIPHNVEAEKLQLIECDADFVLAIETGGMFDRLVENRFDEDARALLVHIKGQPARATRRFLKRLNEELGLDVVAFSVHGDERVLIWEDGILRPVTIGPYIDKIMAEKGSMAMSRPIEHEKTPVGALNIEVPCITDDGRFVRRSKVKSLIRHNAPEELYEVTSAYGFSARLTGSHSLMVFDDFHLVPGPVKNLREDDLVVASMGLPRGEEILELDLVDLLRESSVWPQLRTNVRVNNVRMRVTETLSQGITDFLISYPKSPISFPRRIPVTQSLAKLLGFYAAEGHSGHYCVTLTFGSHEKNLIRDALQCIRDVFPGIHVARHQPHPSSVQLSFGGALLSRIFNVLGAGRDARSKAIPWPVFSMDAERQFAFLKAYVRGDGHARRRRRGSSVTMTTASRALASDLLMLCAQLGFNANVRQRQSTPYSSSGNPKTRSHLGTIYDVSLYGELAQLEPFRELLDQNSGADVDPKQLINSKFLAIPREIITRDLRRIIRTFNRGTDNRPFGQVYWGRKRIPYPVLAPFLANVPEGKSERLDFLRRLVEARIALLPVRRITLVPSSGARVYDLEVPGPQTFLGGLGPLCLHNTDGDPWSFRIFASIAYGAIKTAHISEYLATPSASFLGITASDILNYDLPADELTPQDAKALRDIQTDPRFGDRFWRDEVGLMLEIGKKAEQQALAKYGLDYVTDAYLPEKIAQLGLG